MVPRKVGGGPRASMRHSREVSMPTLWAGTRAAWGRQPAPSHWRNFSGNTYLIPYLPETDFQLGREGQGSKLLAKHYRDTAMIAKYHRVYFVCVKWSLRRRIRRLVKALSSKGRNEGAQEVEKDDSLLDFFFRPPLFRLFQPTWLLHGTG